MNKDSSPCQPHNLVPRVSPLHVPSLARWDVKRPEPGNEVVSLMPARYGVTWGGLPQNYREYRTAAAAKTAFFNRRFLLVFVLAIFFLPLMTFQFTQERMVFFWETSIRFIPSWQNCVLMGKVWLSGNRMEELRSFGEDFSLLQTEKNGALSVKFLFHSE